MLFQAGVQAQEVQSGLWLLDRALSLLRTSVTNAALHDHIDNSIRNLVSTHAVLRSLNFQVREVEGTSRHLGNRSCLLIDFPMHFGEPRFCFYIKLLSL